MPKLSDAKLASRRSDILRAAEICFARDGFHRTTIADVRREAGVSAGAIYTYFPNKQAMVRGILEQARAIRRADLAAPEGPDAGGLSQAFVLLDWVGAVFSAQGRHAARVDVNLWAEALRDPGVADIAAGALREATRAVGAVVGPHLKRQTPRPNVGAGSVAAVLVSLFLGLEVQTAVGVSLDRASVLKVLTVLFAAYLDPPPPPRTAAAPRAKRPRPPVEKSPTRKRAAR